MSKVDRRTIIGAAGATLAVSACGGKSEEIRAENFGGLENFDIIGWKNIHQPAGPGLGNDDPDIQKPLGKNQMPAGAKSEEEFKPLWVCLVYIQFQNNKIYSRHSYFDKAKTNISDEFKSMAGTEKKWINPFPNRDESNFDNFTFGSQQTIYFYIDNKKDGISFDEENKIQMTFFGPRKKTPQYKKEKDKNNAFLNPRIDNTTAPGMELLVIDNWFFGKNKRKIDPKKQNEWEYYSMNIHFLMATADGAGEYKNVPMVIDPDGSNMGSQP